MILKTYHFMAFFFLASLPTLILLVFVHTQLEQFTVIMAWVGVMFIMSALQIKYRMVQGYP